MLSLSAERIWTIMFTIPLPLMLGSGAMAHQPALDTKPIVTAAEITIEPVKLEWPQGNESPDIVSNYPRATCGDNESMRDESPALRDDVAADEPVVLGCNQCLSRDFVTVGEVRPPRLFCASAAVMSRRCDDFVSFRAQAPPGLPVVTYMSLAHCAVLPSQRKFQPHIHSFSTGPATPVRPIHLHFAAVVISDSLSQLESRYRLAAVSIPFPAKIFRQRKRFRTTSESIART
jgi:hypothetical protein